jgi:small-conductance mechanosensitive channel
MKDAISNLVAGLIIIVYEPFDLADTIELDGTRGKVVDIDLRYMTLQTESENVLIPNSNFLTSVIRKGL